MSEQKIAFKPAYGTRQKIDQTNISPGFIYFSTDSGEIFLDTKDERVKVGSSSAGASLFYSSQPTSEEMPIGTMDDDDGTNYYVLDSAYVDTGEAEIKVDDLIIGTDGAFYRFVKVNAEGNYFCTRMAISGSGGGGGGGGGIVEPTLKVTIDSSTLDSNATLVQGQNYYVSVTGEAINGNTDRYVSLNFEFTGNDGYSEAFTQSGIRSGEPYKLNLNFLPINSNITMTVSVDSDNAGMAVLPSTRKRNIKVVDMHIDKQSGTNYIAVQSGDLQLRYIPYGKGLNVKLHTAVDGEEFDNNVKLIDDNMENAQTVAIPRQSHGQHTIDLWLSADVNRVTLSSDPISFEASWADDEEDTPLIWVGDITPVVIQYESAIIPYMVYDSVNERNGAPTTVDFYKNGSQVSSELVRYSADGWLYWDVTTLYDVGENEFMISSGATSKRINFSVTTEGSRDLSLVNQSALDINFDSMGRSSTEIAATRGIWKSKVKDYSAVLNNFNWYNNGWKDDKDGLGSYLSIANGASVQIPYKTITMNTGSTQYTFEIRFRIKNAQKYATLVTEIPLYKYWTSVTERDANGRAIAGTLNNIGEEQTIDWIRQNGYEVKLDSDGNMEMEESNTTRKIVETENNVVFKYLNSNNEGFCIGTQEAYFNTAGKTVNVRYKEGEIINITFVVDKAKDTLSIYLNGILSGAVNLTGIAAITMENIPFKINSNYCDFDLYKFRIYTIALTMPEVIHNYLADIKDINLYDENQLTDVNDATKLSYAKLVQHNIDHPDNLTMPYVLIDSSGTPNDDELPHFKGGNKKVSITFVNPTADKLLEDGLISDYEYYTHCPSFTADNVDINVQGTSSQKYPRRNFKTKFKKAKNWNYTKGELAGQSVMGVPQEQPDGKIKYKDFTLADGNKLAKNWHMDNVDLATNVFTWKIDYMESSGSYNSGFANLMGSGIYNKHPLDDIGFDASQKNYRTSVYGFPYLCFHKRADGSITYIGRYNWNLDKGSNEYYGFKEDYEQPYMNGETVADISECWELRDNQGTWCSFRYPNDAARELGFMTPTADSTNENPKIEVAQHFEARYNAEADAFKTAQSYKTIDDGGDDWSEVIGGTSNADICAYMNRKMANLKVLFDWLDSTDTTHARPDFVFDTPIKMSVTARSDDPTVTYTTEMVGGSEKLFGTFHNDTVEYRRQKFRNEFNKHLDRHYCTIYFIMTELLLCYDSRGKNMMIASFGPHEQGGDYIWYPIFYDIDTQLGLNNVGALLWDYDEDSTENKTFSTGDSVLWTNFYDMFQSEIIATYKALRNTKITYNTIEGAYTFNPDVFTNSYAMRGVRPIVAIGLDEYYKYVLPVTEKWKMQDGTYGTANYLYACQGDRILSRELLINNRLLYMDSKWHSGSFTVQQTMNAVAFRVSGNDPANTSDKYLDNVNHAENQIQATYPVPFYDANPVYKITPYLNFYITWFTDENTFANSEAYSAIKYPDGMDTIVSTGVLESFKSGTVDEQLNYFSGADYISSFGDLSTKYATEVAWPQGAKLLDITLGSDAPNYYNNKLKVANFDLGTGANSNEKPLLQKINLTHLRNFDTFLDITNPKKLREFRALDTKLKYALFADGAPLTIVHLPSTVTILKFIQNKNLTRILKTAPVVADVVDNKLVYRPESEYAGLYVEGLTDYVSGAPIVASDLGIIEFEGDALGYDSYTILRNAVEIKENAGGRLKIRMDEIDWSPYTQVEYGETKQDGVNYYYVTDHSTYEPYTRTTWENDTLNGRVYTFDESAPKSTITSLELLDKFIDDYEDGLSRGAINQFTNNNDSMASRATVPTITGSLFVANADGTAIAEDELTNKYGKYWPNLIIRAENISESYIAKYVQIIDSGKENEIDVIRFAPSQYENQNPTRTTKIPSKTNYTFKGWALDPEGNKMVWNYDLLTQTFTDGQALSTDECKFSETNSVITLYAIFELQKFGIKFYDGDGNLLVEDANNPVYLITGLNQQEQVTVLVPYGQYVPTPKRTPYKNDLSLPLEDTYILRGWSTTPDGDLANIAQKKVTSNLSYYPIFEIGDVHNNPISEEFFETEDYTYTNDVRGAYSLGEPCVYIKLKEGYSVRGKVTLPKTVGGVKVGGLSISSSNESLNGFSHNTEITHIFWETGAVPEVYDKYCLANCTSLAYVEFPASLSVIRENAFRRCESLENRSLAQCIHLISIDANAFNHALKPTTNTTFIIPGCVKALGTNSFSYNDTVGGATAITTFQIGDINDPSNLATLPDGSGNPFRTTSVPYSYIIYTNKGKEDAP